MAVPREKILISVAGRDGDHAIQYFGHRDNVAQFGRVGANGRSATAPNAGTNGSDISVQLSYSQNDAALLVEGTRAWKGPADGQTRWVVNDSQVLLLNARGGDGGKGGNGEDGQQGGQGARGRDATKHRDAEDGYEGARGGDGGYGTNGANGGNAGKALITVNEDDLDLLIPVYWDIRGGKGGESGSHGDPGDGGLGGDPGSGITWTEHRQNVTIERSRPPGRRGPVGPPGARPPSYLQGGMGGAQGSSQVTVKRNDGTEATYPTRYELKVVSFDVVDENDDGINEPGEHLIVKNIRVQNTGGMPSPKNHSIRVLIHGTHWLEPLATEPVYLPKNIQADEIVEVPGVLRAFIMQERVARAPGVVFSARDEVQLIATMPRINRVIPEFKGSTSIEIRYPLQLSPPKYLDCVSPGDHITFTWTLKNISRKSYGINGELRRSAGTLVKDPGQLFNFIEAESGNAHVMVDPLEVLDPNSEVDISQTFEVSGMAMPYSSGLLTLELLLSEPGADPNRFSDLGTNILHGQHTRSTIGYPMHMQISGVYSHNPHSAFLLVVNSQTPNSAIHQIIRFIRNELHLALDIFNLSVTGSFTDPATGRNVLQNYPGKSVIIFGNKFSYFSAGTSSAFDLLDPYLACQLATLGTNFHFAGATENLDAMRTWVSMSTFPVYAYNPHPASPESLRAETFKELAGALHTRGALNVQISLPVHSIPAASGMFSCMSTPDSALESAAQSTVDKLQKQFPLRRFAVSGDTSTRTPDMPGTVVIREGFAKFSHLTASLLPYTAEDPDLADYQKYMIVCCLPFHTRARMFWNMAGALDAGGILSTVIYRGKELEAMKPPITVSSSEILAVSEKLCKFISLSIEYDLGREIGIYTNDAPFMDGIPVQHSIAQLPLLNKFFDMETPTDIVRTTERTQFIIQTLGIIQGSLLSFSFGESFGGMLAVSRKSALKKQVDLLMNDFLLRRFAPDVVTFLKAESDKDAKTTKTLVKGIPGATSTKAVCLVRLATTVQMHNARFEDLTEINASSTKWTKPIADSKVIAYTGFVSRLQNQEACSRQILGNMVTKIEPGSPTSPTAPAQAHFEAISPAVAGAHEMGS